MFVYTLQFSIVYIRNVITHSVFTPRQKMKWEQVANKKKKIKDEKNGTKRNNVKRKSMYGVRILVSSIVACTMYSAHTLERKKKLKKIKK